MLSVGGTLVRGSIDLLARRADGSVLVVDYKTDRLDGRDPSRGRRAATRIQRDLYALAAAARGAPVETAYVFLEQPDEPVRESFGERRARARRATRSRGGCWSGSRPAASRSPTIPTERLCLDCPARERLCSHEPTATLRDDPEPPIPSPTATGAARAAAAPRRGGRRTPAHPAARQDEPRGLRLRLAGLAESASMTLGRPVPRAAPGAPARLAAALLPGARQPSPARRPSRSPTARRRTGSSGLNVERGEDDAGPVNGVLIELSEAELDRLDIREIRYDRVEVTDLIEADGPLPERVITYSAKESNFAPEPPAGTVILATYAAAVEAAFEAPRPRRARALPAPPPAPTRSSASRRRWSATGSRTATRELVAACNRLPSGRCRLRRLRSNESERGAAGDDLELTPSVPTKRPVVPALERSSARRSRRGGYGSSRPAARRPRGSATSRRGGRPRPERRERVRARRRSRSRAALSAARRAARRRRGSRDRSR